MKSKHLEFEWIEEKPKTNVWQVRSRHDKAIIGTIKWYANWRQYCFFPEANCVWSKGCLKDLCDFIESEQKTHVLKSKASPKKGKASIKLMRRDTFG